MRLLDYQLLGTAAAPRRGPAVSLTALIDVVFILLLFFMLTSSFLQWRSMDVVVDTPGATAQATPEEAFIIRLAADGSLRFGDQHLLPPVETAHLRATLPNPLDRPVVVEPAGDASTQQIVHLLDQLKLAGVSRLSLANAAN